VPEPAAGRAGQITGSSVSWPCSSRSSVAGRDPSKNLLGAEVRFSYRTNSFRGAQLPVTWSLVRIERDGTLGPVVRGQDRALATTVTPDACSATGGKDPFVAIPQPGKRYRVVLELYRNGRLDDRLALAETRPSAASSGVDDDLSPEWNRPHQVPQVPS
jgi:hypothetical protein